MLLGAMSGGGVVVAVAYAALAVVALRMALSYKSALYAVRRLWRWADEWAQAYQYHEVPRFACDGGGAENPLFRKAAQYVAALPSLEDADAASVLSSASRTNGGFSLQLGPGHTARDAFLGARLAWTNRGDVLVLRVRRHDRTRVLRPYLQHVESVADEMELRRRELRLFANTGVDGSTGTPRWASAPFTHPATLDTVAMDPDLKARVRADLENFLKGRAYYHRLGRVWRRSYLLYGPPGTGKSTFAAAMARFLGYDIYDVDLSRAGSDDLRALLLHTTPRSLILVEDLDRFLQGGGAGDAEARAARVLSFMDGVASCCGEERVMVFTMRGGKEGVDAAVVRPGRLDVHIHFTLCDFEAFKALASNYLGLKDHKLYPQVEESFHGGARLSPAELGEIMLANRSSPSRALRNVITKLQLVSGAAAAPRPPHRRNTSWSGAGGPWEEQAARASADAADGGEEAITATAACGVFAKDAPMREFKKLYGLIKIRSRKEGSGGFMPLHGGEAPSPANGRGREHDKER
ncbi:AAA-ATPase At2g46620-like [Oryza glaberrima]|uniref:AAA+ ATPase domain-containing protein n=1 Tax=Oryza glaberrima TaxID=4538 RepID=I1P6U6_ORYGL|nr:AAA-ATPase At2g46620-like [Oryza glaberrima]